MVDTCHKTEEEMKEHFSDEKVIDKQAKELADLIKNSKHCIFFTGAGISTSCGIPDFRGPTGVWTLRAKKEERKTPTTSTIKAIASPTHMSIKQLIDKGLVKHLISQNTDGLHRRSGVNPLNLSELHGNSQIETCGKCKKEYLRDFRVRKSGIKALEHETDRKCSVKDCGGQLYDSIINFGESLPKKCLEKAFYESSKADLIVCLGSSLTVSPANECPVDVHDNGGKVVICNLQITPKDDICDLRVFGKCDDLMIKVMGYLNLDIPKYIVQKRAQIGVKDGKIYVRGTDKEGIDCSYFSQVSINNQVIDQEPWELKNDKDLKKVDIVLKFMGHYNEPDLSLSNVDLSKKNLYVIDYDPLKGTFKIALSQE